MQYLNNMDKSEFNQRSTSFHAEDSDQQSPTQFNRDISEEVDHVESFALDLSQPDSKYRAVNAKFSQVIQSPSVKSVIHLKRFR